MSGGNVQPSLDAAEHIGAIEGEGIEAKRVGAYGWSGVIDKWQRQPLPLLDRPWDYVEFTNDDGQGNYQTLTFKTGGSTGDIARTLSLTYDGASNLVSLTRT